MITTCEAVAVTDVKFQWRVALYPIPGIALLAVGHYWLLLIFSLGFYAGFAVATFIAAMAIRNGQNQRR
jgi:hypothetical protein